MADPLAELLEHLEDTGAPPPGWQATHAPDGDLARVWAASDDLDALLRAAATCAPRPVLVRAACACARTALSCVQPPPAPVAHALARTEAWCQGAATADAVRAAFEAIEYLEDPAPTGHFARDATWGYARTAVAAAADAVSFDPPEDAASGAARSARDALAMHALAHEVSTGPLFGDDPRWAAATAAATTRVADLLRAHLPCPTLDQLRAAFAP